MASAISSVSSIIPFSSSSSSKRVSIISDKHNVYFQSSFHKRSTGVSSSTYHINPLHRNGRNLETLIVRSTEDEFPDPIPEFAEAETEKFKNHLRSHLVRRLLKRLRKKIVIKKETLSDKRKKFYKDRIDEVVGICTEIFSAFLHTEYGGPGTLLLDPFQDMDEKMSERNLAQGPEAASAALKWARRHVDEDWKEWTGSEHNNKQSIM